MRKFNKNLASVVAIIFVLSLAVGSIAYSYTGEAKMVCESGSNCVFNESSLPEEADLGALVSPFIYTKLYLNGGMEVVDGGMTVTDDGLTITDDNLTVSDGVRDFTDDTSTSTLLTNMLVLERTQVEYTGYSEGAVDGIGSCIHWENESSYGAGSSTAKLCGVLDDVTQGSQESSIYFQQVLDNGTSLSTVLDIDSGVVSVPAGDFKVNTDDFVVDIDGDISLAPTGADVNVTGDVDISGGALTLDTLTPIADDTMTTADGNVVFLAASSSAYTVTLPAAADGLAVMVIVSGDNTAVTAASTTIASAEGDNIHGTLDVNAADVACSGEDQFVMHSAKETIGDFIKLISDGTSWFIIGSQVETAAAFTCTDPS